MVSSEQGFDCKSVAFSSSPEKKSERDLSHVLAITETLLLQA
jgi:hypothetical protein